jgi:hypothetical protein
LSGSIASTRRGTGNGNGGRRCVASCRDADRETDRRRNFAVAGCIVGFGGPTMRAVARAGERPGVGERGSGVRGLKRGPVVKLNLGHTNVVRRGSRDRHRLSSCIRSPRRGTGNGDGGGRYVTSRGVFETHRNKRRIRRRSHCPTSIVQNRTSANSHGGCYHDSSVVIPLISTLRFLTHQIISRIRSESHTACKRSIFELARRPTRHRKRNGTTGNIHPSACIY